ncbi:HAD family hydrolase [Streptomyces zingiberis]|uniref:HAD-IA family hydrolase n=1 Tax=Streptomyces zingiberis TaxID=2053010 RepID=A0ABX1BWE9_9ACTN|nr:HAD-IA family hydrolase [Streptomyces zingiberis]
MRAVRAWVLDTDGVITDSARLHAAAWRAAFDTCLREHPPPAPADRRPFDPDGDYRHHVDGRARLDGAAAFLASRGLRLPVGAPGDPPGTGSVQAVAALKDHLFVERLRAGGIAAYPGTVRLLRVLLRAGVPRAAASASRHAGELLESAGVRELFDALVDGREADRLRLPGKPDPALFVEAAARLGVPVRESAVVEDATAGVAAGRRGGFGLVVGVDRTDGREGGTGADGTGPGDRDDGEIRTGRADRDGGAGGGGRAADLLRHGADLVVADLADLLAPGAGDAGTHGGPAGPATAEGPA